MPEVVKLVPADTEALSALLANAEAKSVAATEPDAVIVIFGGADDVDVRSPIIGAFDPAPSKIIMWSPPLKFKLVKPSDSFNGLSKLENKYVRAPVYDAIFDVTSNWLNKSNVGTFYKYAVLAPKAASQVAKTILSPFLSLDS